MDQQPLEQVLRAISILYSPQQRAEETSTADQFLQTFMKKTEAWEVIPQLLKSQPNCPFYQQRIYYGAIMLKKKVCFNFKEITNFKELFGFILECLTVFKTQKMITSHLAQSLTALCVQSNSWNDYFPLIVQNFPLTDTSNIPILLMIFTSIAEAERKLSFASQEYLYSLHDNLIRTAPTILDFIKRASFINASYAFDCLNSWLQNIKISITLLHQYGIIQMIFAGIKEKSLREPSSDAFFYFVKKLRSLNQETSEEEVKLSIDLLRVILDELIGSINSIVQTTSGDIDDFNSVSDFYCTLGFVLTTYIDHIDPKKFVMYYQLLSQFTTVRSQRNIARITDVVIDLCEYLNKFAHANQRDQICLALNDTFVSIFENIIKNQIPLIDTDEEALDEYVEFRKDVISDLVRRISEVVPIQQLLTIISAICHKTIIEQCQIAEAALFCFRSLARVLSDVKSETILNILQSIVKIESTNTQLLHTSVFCVGRYCDWIHSFSPQFAPIALQYILKYITIPALMEPVCISFENLCDGCAVDFIPLIEPITQSFSAIYQQMPQLWKIGGNSGFLAPVINGYCLLLKEHPLEVKLKYIDTFIPPLINNLPQATSQEMVSVLIGILTCWFDHGSKLGLQNVTVSFLQKYEVIPVLVKLMDVFILNKNEKLIEEISGCIRYLFFFIGGSVVELTQIISQHMVQWWEKTHLASIIKMFTFLTRALKRENDRTRDANCAQKTFGIIPPLLDSVFQFLMQQPKSSFTDVVTECFILISFLIDRYPFEFGDSILQQRLIPWALNFLDTFNGETFGTIVDSLILFFHTNRSHYSNTYIQMQGEILIRNLFANARKMSSKTKREKVIHLMSLLYEQNPELIAAKTTIVIQSDYNFLPTQIIDLFASIKLKKYDYQSLVDDFFYICRETA